MFRFRCAFVFSLVLALEVVSASSFARPLQGQVERELLDQDLTPESVRSRFDALLSGQSSLTHAETVATLEAAGAMRGRAFWGNVLILLNQLPKQYTLDCYVAAFRLRARESGAKVIEAIDAVQTSGDIDRVYFGLRVLGLYPELRMEKAAAAAIERIKGRGPRERSDERWRFRIQVLGSQIVYLRFVRALQEKYSSLSTPDEKARFLIALPMKSDPKRCLGRRS